MAKYHGKVSRRVEIAGSGRLGQNGVTSSTWLSFDRCTSSIIRCSAITRSVISRAWWLFLEHIEFDVGILGRLVAVHEIDEQRAHESPADVGRVHDANLDRRIFGTWRCGRRNAKLSFRDPVGNQTVNVLADERGQLVKLFRLLATRPLSYEEMKAIVRAMLAESQSCPWATPTRVRTPRARGESAHRRARELADSNGPPSRAAGCQ
jgi:hypothetical protein